MTAGLLKAVSGQSRQLHKDHVLSPSVPSPPRPTPRPRVPESIRRCKLRDAGVIFTSLEPASGGETDDSGTLDMADLRAGKIGH